MYAIAGGKAELSEAQAVKGSYDVLRVQVELGRMRLVDYKATIKLCVQEMESMVAALDSHMKHDTEFKRPGAFWDSRLPGLRSDYIHAIRLAKSQIQQYQKWGSGSGVHYARQAFREYLLTTLQIQKRYCERLDMDTSWYEGSKVAAEFVNKAGEFAVVGGATYLGVKPAAAIVGASYRFLSNLPQVIAGQKTPIGLLGDTLKGAMYGLGSPAKAGIKGTMDALAHLHGTLLKNHKLTWQACYEALKKGTVSVATIFLLTKGMEKIACGMKDTNVGQKLAAKIANMCQKDPEGFANALLDFLAELPFD